MTDIKWENPPADGRSRWTEIFAELRKRPNEWALVREEAPVSTASQIKKGLLGNSRPGEFEARSVHGDNPSRGKIYARYVGE